MQATSQATVPQYDSAHWLSALDAAEAAFAEPCPERNSYTRGEFGEDCYQLALEKWEVKQSKARRLHRLATAKLAALQ